MPASKDHSSPHRILVVDDHRAIHDDFRKVLEGQRSVAPADRLGAEIFGDEPGANPDGYYEMDASSQGAEAREMVRQAVEEGRPYAVAFVDIRMPPGWNGVETVARLREVDPDLQFVICTAYSDYSWSEIRRQLGPSQDILILKKPFDKIEVLQFAQALTRKWTLAREVARQIAGLDAAVEARTAELRAAKARLEMEIADRERAESALLQSQRMEAIGQLAAGVAHDFNNILTVVRGHTSLMLKRPALNPETANSLHEVSAAAERATSLASQLLVMSRRQNLNPQTFNLNATLERLHALLSRVLGETIVLRRECDPNLPALVADETRIEQALMNLAVNARDAMPRGGTLTIGARPCRWQAESIAGVPEAKPGDFIAITVADTGTGMPPDVLRHLFEPFFTTKGRENSSGLGLATAYSIVKQHRGWIEVDSTPGRGSVFRIYLPASPVPLLAPAPPAPVILSEHLGAESILLVEDEPAVRAVIRDILLQAGYRVVEVPNGDEALDLWKHRSWEFDLLITDLIMPGILSGQALAEQLCTERPSLRVLLTTGYSEVCIDEDRFGANIAILRKPFSAEVLLAAVRECLEAAQPALP